MSHECETGCGYHGFLERGGIIPAPFGVVGVSHRTATVKMRSQVSLPKDEILGFIRTSIESGLREIVVLSTCNRTEIYFSGANPDTVAELLARHSGIPLRELYPHLYQRVCVCAACHLFRVVAGLDSAVLGETEIVAQTKEAWKTSVDADATGPTLDLLFQRGLEASKRIRTETELCRNVTSTGSLAVRVAAKAVTPFSNADALIIGAGKIATRIAKDLSESNVRSVRIVNRTSANAQDLADKFKFESDTYENLVWQLSEVDVVFGTVSAAHPVIDKSLVEAVMINRDNRPLLIVDLGVPANVSVEVAKIPHVRVVHLEELVEECSENSDRRTAAVPQALEILEQELARFGPALTERAAAPTIRALMERGDEIRSRNVNWAKDKLEHLSEKDLRTVEEMARRMMIGLLQAPIEGLKSHLAAQEHREVVEKLFDLPGGSTHR